MRSVIPWLCLVLWLTTPNAVWALSAGDCASVSDTVEAMDHSGMDHSAHEDAAGADTGTMAEVECACCADSCAAHCAGGAAFVRVMSARPDGARFGRIIESRHAASYVPTPPVSGLFRPPIVS